MLEYIHGKRFGSKIAWANRRRVAGWGWVQVQKQAMEGNDPHGLFLYLDSPPTLSPSSCWLRLFLSQTFSCICTPTFLKPSPSSHLPAYEDGADRAETSAYKIQTLGNYPEESIQHSTWRKFEIKISCVDWSAVEVTWFYNNVNSVHSLPYTHISESIAAFNTEIWYVYLCM